MGFLTAFFLGIFLVSCIAILIPFRPFKRRANAFFAAAGCLLIISFIGANDAPSNKPDTQQQASNESNIESEEFEKISRAEIEANLKTVDEYIEKGQYLDANEYLIRTRYAVTDVDLVFFNSALSEAKIKIANSILDDAEIDSSNPKNSIDQFRVAYFTATKYCPKEIANEVFEPKFLEFVRRIPSSDAKNNEAGYKLLSEINPNNDGYQASLEKYKQQKFRSALAAFRSQHDKISQTTFYTHKYAPQYINSRSTVYLYIGNSGDANWLRMKTVYASDDWLFVEKVIAYADGEVFTLTSGDFDRDNSTSIWEWRDEKPTAHQIKVLRKLANANDATLRFSGTKYRDDVQLGRQDKLTLIKTLDTYDVLNNR